MNTTEFKSDDNVSDLIERFIFFSNLLNELDAKKPFDRYRVVYGGQYTILLDKTTGKRVCSVKREKGDKNNLTKAVLYLVFKLKKVYGTEIENYFHTFDMTRYGVMMYLLQYGNHKNYKPEDIDGYLKMIDRENDPEVGFMYMIMADRFNVKKEQIDILIENAICSETDKTRLRLSKKRKYEKHARSKRTAKTRKEIEKEC